MSAVSRSTKASLNQIIRDRYLPHAQARKRSWATDETLLPIHIIPTLGCLTVDPAAETPEWRVSKARPSSSCFKKVDAGCNHDAGSPQTY
jgi:hypothetical protein